MKKPPPKEVMNVAEERPSSYPTGEWSIPAGSSPWAGQKEDGKPESGISIRKLGENKELVEELLSTREEWGGDEGLEERWVLGRRRTDTGEEMLFEPTPADGF